MRVELVERAMRGDPEAFASLAADSVDRCYALAYRILRDPHRAQDATQQALLGAWRDLPTLRDPARFDAWLRSSSSTPATRRRAASAAGPPGSASSLPIFHSSPTLRAPSRARDELEHAFRRLTAEQRAVVVLHHHLGYPLTEIAATLGIPEGTARSRLHYAVRQLRAALDERRTSLVTSEERPA